MTILIVTDTPDDWPLHVAGVQVVAAREYISNPVWNSLSNARVFNLCRSYTYQSLGYYVSLLAEARGHKPQPDVITIQDMKSMALVRAISDDLDALIQKTLHPLQSDKMVLSIYFGRTLAKRDAALGLRLFELFRSPMLRATFLFKEKWRLQSLRPIPASEVPREHMGALIEAATNYLRRRQWSGGGKAPQYSLAVLVDPKEKHPPSEEQAFAKLSRAGASLGMSVEYITKDDFERLPVFDALFIRTTTGVNDYTYRFARRAQAEGMPVIDDPLSIARCCNKVFQSEKLAAAGIATPPTCIVHRGNLGQVIDKLSLPLVMKKPDSAFSMGVRKVSTREEFERHAKELFEQTALFIAQAFMPTDFDWRVGVLDGKPLFVCRYYMASKHWQIMKQSSSGRTSYGKTDTLAVEEAPEKVVKTAVKATKLIGDGLYGVDLKQFGNKVCVIEINDNPNLDAGFEDAVLKDKLWERVIQSFIDRIERMRQDSAKQRKSVEQ